MVQALLQPLWHAQVIALGDATTQALWQAQILALAEAALQARWQAQLLTLAEATMQAHPQVSVRIGVPRHTATGGVSNAKKNRMSPSRR